MYKTTINPGFYYYQYFVNLNYTLYNIIILIFPTLLTLVLLIPTDFHLDNRHIE